MSGWRDLLVWPWHVQLAAFALLLALTAQGCRDVVIYSQQGGQKSGEFYSPNWPDEYQKNQHCFYKFFGLPNERVHVNFTTFKVSGLFPRCEQDYVDIYTQIEYSDQDLLEVPLQGRHCGERPNDVPGPLVSVGNTLVLGFFAAPNKPKIAARGFSGMYSFIDAYAWLHAPKIPHFNMGTPAPKRQCGYTVRSTKRKTGYLMSPTYPGIYPDNILCFYRLQGVSGERIKLEFETFDLFSGGNHCPYDYIRIYDGHSSASPVIGTYCGKHRDLTIYSTAEALHIEFVTKSGRLPPTQKTYKTYLELADDYAIKMTGFRLKFSFSTAYVNLNFIGNNGIHLRGTQCDQRVLSRGEDNGTVISPGFPDSYPMNIECRYYIDGLLDKQNLEKVILSFESFDVPTLGRGCDNGCVRAYGRGQTDLQYPDRVYCGNAPPAGFTSSHPRLLLVFNSTGEKPGRGFKAKYQFEIDYGVLTGTMIMPKLCHFMYRSSSVKDGSFNSPRYPSRYPANLECIYEFFAEENERIRLAFDIFSLAEVQSAGEPCRRDRVTIYEVYPDDEVQAGREILLGEYCGQNGPGPLLTNRGATAIKFVFHSDSEDSTVGFKATYNFMPEKDPINECGANITSGFGGVITSPNYPKTYVVNGSCEWWIYPSKPGNRLLLEFQDFKMEGTEASCNTAVLNIYLNSSKLPTQSICGSESKVKQLISSTPVRLRLIVSQNQIGDKGFAISWTELIDERGEECDGLFRCRRSGYCIARHLECNEYYNCGINDRSDETIACPRPPAYNVLHIALGVAITLFLLIVILVCLFHRRRRTVKKKHHPNHIIKHDDSDIRFMIDQAHCSRNDSRSTLNRETMQKISIV